jgi:hypothetical protein
MIWDIERQRRRREEAERSLDLPLPVPSNETDARIDREERQPR